MKIRYSIASYMCMVTLTIFTTNISAQHSIMTARSVPFGIVNYAEAVSELDVTHFIDGYVRKYGSSSFVFPTGDNGHRRPFVASASGTYGAYFRADPSIAITSDENGDDYPPLPLGAPFSRDLRNSNVDKVSNQEYWDINGSVPTKISLTWNESSTIGEMLSGRGLEKLIIVGWNGSLWEKVPATVDATSVVTNTTSTLSAGSITTTYDLTPDLYNIYSFGVESAGALPVILMSFKARKIENFVRLDWETVSEENSDAFEVQRSKNGNDWDKIGKVEAKGENAGLSHSNVKYMFEDFSPLSGNTLYRLKMVDLDGSFAYSSIQSILRNSENTTFVYPNPAANRIFVKETSLDRSEHIALYDMTGKAVLRWSSFQSDVGLDVSRVPDGIYIVKLRSNKGLDVSYPIIIKK